MAKAHSPETLVRNVFSLSLVGIAVEILFMMVLPRLGS